MDFHDFQNIQFYPTAALQSLSLDGESSFLAPEMMAEMLARGCRFLEVPITFISADGGRGPKARTLRSILRSVHDTIDALVPLGLALQAEPEEGSPAADLAGERAVLAGGRGPPAFDSTFKYFRDSRCTVEP